MLAELARQAEIKHTSWSATIFVVMGFLFGPQALDVFAIETLHRFDLLISLLIGVVGFVLGIEFRHATRARAFVAGSFISCLSIFILSSLVFIIVAAFISPLDIAATELVYFNLSLPSIVGVESLEIAGKHIWPGLAIGAIFSCPSMISNEGLGKLFQAKGVAVPRLLQVSAIFESLAVLFFGLTLAAGRAVGSAGELNLTVTEWAVIATFSGLVCGILFALFIGREMEPSTLFMATIGAVTFSAGLGHVLGVSPIFVNLIFGYSVAIFSQQSMQIKRELDRLARPLSIILFFFAGAYWSFGVLELMILPILYILLRPIFFKVIPKFYLRRILLETEKPAATVGQALISQDHIAVAMALAFQQRFPISGEYIVSIVIIGILASQVIGPIWLRRWFVDQGAIDLKG